ncbi:MAG: DJ-1/PfpI family protein [Rhodothermales bacterium]
MSKKILLITGDAGESYEALYARHRFMEAGYKPVLAAPAKKRLNLVIHDFEPGWDTYIEKPGYIQESDITFDEVKVKDYIAVLVLGGRAPEYLRHDKRVLAIVREFDKKEKWVWAICHGIQVLITAGIAGGRTLTCYEHVRSEVEACGGTWSKQQAIRDGRFVTGQTWQSHPDFYREVFACLGA